MCEIDNFVVSENYDIRIWTGSGPSQLGQTVPESLLIVVKCINFQQKDPKMKLW